LDEPVPLEIVPVDEAVAVQPAKKMTPRKKQLATKVKKATPTKAGKGYSFLCILETGTPMTNYVWLSWTCYVWDGPVMYGCHCQYGSIMYGPVVYGNC